MKYLQFEKNINIGNFRIASVWTYINISFWYQVSKWMPKAEESPKWHSDIQNSLEKLLSIIVSLAISKNQRCSYTL